MQDAGSAKNRVVDIIGMAGTLAVAILIGYVLVGTSLRRMAVLTEEQQTLTAQLEHLTELATTLGQGEETLGMLQTGMEEIDRRLPGRMEFEQFYSALTSLAAKNRVLISEMTPGEIQKEDSYLEMPITITAIAAFEDFHEFLFGLSNQTRLTKLDSLNIRVAREAGLCNIDMTVKIYAAKQSASEDNGE